MGSFEIIRIVPEAERPTEIPIPPMPTCQGSATEKDWDEYWIKRDSFYSGIELRKV